jgi:hypothetical protein
VALVAGGLAHRPVVSAEHQDAGAAVLAAHDYVLGRHPAYAERLAGLDVMRVEQDLYRACVPSGDPRRWLCLFVTTDRRPPGVRRDGDQAPNASYRSLGGFR